MGPVFYLPNLPVNCLAITYNVLNLQYPVSQIGRTVASYTWLADGTKCGVVDNNNNGYDYTGSLIYSRSGSVRTPENIDNGTGRIIYSGGTYNPHYYITDHLGSTRVITDNSGSVVERDDYYPFGGQLAISTYPQLSVNRFKFNGKELQTTGNTGFLDYGARMYDDVIGRWGVVDPMAEMDYNSSPYSYVCNAPINLIDPDGRSSIDFMDENYCQKLISEGPTYMASTHTDENGNVLAVYDDGDLGVYVHHNGTTTDDVDRKHSSSNTSAGGTKIGETYYWDEFRYGDRILFNQKWEDELIDLAEDGIDDGRIPLAFKSRTGRKFDLKSRYSLGNNRYVGKLMNGKYISAESAGNFLAGFNASGRGGLSFIKYMQLAGAYDQGGLIAVINNYVTGQLYGKYPWYGENNYAGRMIVWGWLSKSPQDSEAIGISINYNRK